MVFYMKKEKNSYTKKENARHKNTKKIDNSVKNKKKFFSKIKFINKTSVVYFLILLFDILLVIFCAMKNKVHYIHMFDEKIFVGNTKDLLIGRNYVNLIIITFFWIYTLLLNRFFLKRKNSAKFIIGVLLFLIILNFSLFYIFVEKIY